MADYGLGGKVTPVQATATGAGDITNNSQAFTFDPPAQVLYIHNLPTNSFNIYVCLNTGTASVTTAHFCLPPGATLSTEGNAMTVAQLALFSAGTLSYKTDFYITGIQ